MTLEVQRPLPSTPPHCWEFYGSGKKCVVVVMGVHLAGSSKEDPFFFLFKGLILAKAAQLAEE